MIQQFLFLPHRILRFGRRLAALGLCCGAAAMAAPLAFAGPIQTRPGLPPVTDPNNLYSETAAGKLSPAVAGALARIYVPNRVSSDVYVIDPTTLKVVARFKVGSHPQHIVPSWDLK